MFFLNSYYKEKDGVVSEDDLQKPMEILNDRLFIYQLIEIFKAVVALN